MLLHVLHISIAVAAVHGHCLSHKLVHMQAGTSYLLLEVSSAVIASCQLPLSLSSSLSYLACVELLSYLWSGSKYVQCLHPDITQLQLQSPTSIGHWTKGDSSLLC